MSISAYVHRLNEHRHERRDLRELDRAIANAPTQASRSELELLARR